MNQHVGEFFYSFPRLLKVYFSFGLVGALTALWSGWILSYPEFAICGLVLVSSVIFFRVINSAPYHAWMCATIKRSAQEEPALLSNRLAALETNLAKLETNISSSIAPYILHLKPQALADLNDIAGQTRARSQILFLMELIYAKYTETLSEKEMGEKASIVLPNSLKSIVEELTIANGFPSESDFLEAIITSRAAELKAAEVKSWNERIEVLERERRRERTTLPFTISPIPYQASEQIDLGKRLEKR